MDRRQFLALSGAGAFAWLQGPRIADARPLAQRPDIPFGESPLGLSDDGRDGTLYVPKSYKDGAPMPLLMMLHGFRGTAQGVRMTFPLAEEFGVIVIAPESRDITWGQSAPGFDPDVHYLAGAYKYVADLLDVDPTHVALGGISDGAGYALSMGLAYGDIFNHLMIFSGGLMLPYRKQGKPHIFIAHGLNDTQMPIDQTARRFVPELKGEGYDVTLREYDGGHGAPLPIVREAFEWFLADTKPR
jgi:phospholipase/carboxylesterase